MDVYVQFWAPFPSSSFCLKAQQVLEEAALCAWRGAVARLHVCSREMEPGWKVKPSQMEVLLNTPSSPSLKSSVFFVKLSCYSSSLENVSPVLFSAVTSNRWWFAARARPGPWGSSAPWQWQLCTRLWWRCVSLVRQMPVSFGEPWALSVLLTSDSTPAPDLGWTCLSLSSQGAFYYRVCCLTWKGNLKWCCLLFLWLTLQSQPCYS